MVTFPDNPKDGETVVDKVDDYVAVVWTYSEEKNEWTSHRYGPTDAYVFTDQVLVRDNAQELSDGVASDPSELRTQKDVNHFLNDNAGGGDLEERLALLEKALLPWVEFTDEYRSCSYSAGGNHVNASVRMNQYWSSSPAGNWTWAWMVRFPGSDEWTDVDDLSDEVARSIGYDGAEQSTYLYLYPYAEIPEIEVQLKVTDSLEGFEDVEEWSEPFFPGPVWNNKQVLSSTSTARKSGRVRARNGDGTLRADEPRISGQA